MSKPLSCGICQPHYLPWIGYFEMIDRVDVFVFLDDVQFIKREWKNRNRIRKSARSQEALWLTVPINRCTQRCRLDRTFPADHGRWHVSHVRSMKHTYSHAPKFDTVSEKLFEAMRPGRGESLADMNIRSTIRICELLGIETKLMRSSQMNAVGVKGDKLLCICSMLGINHYLANDRSEQYLDLGLFVDAGVAVEFQRYVHPVYGQWHRSVRLPFLSHLSIVDLLFNHGAASLDILRSDRGKRQS